jgi:hypothetical protein
VRRARQQASVLAQQRQHCARRARPDELGILVH